MERIYPEASVFRSKNAGPFLITVDIMFDEKDKFDRAVKSGAIARKSIAACYVLPEKSIKIYIFPPAMAVKIVFPRKISSGAPGDRDVYGAQQAGCLEDLL